MPLTPGERERIREVESLKKEIRDELQPQKAESSVSKFFQHQAVLLALGFLLTTATGSWLTYFWKQREWTNQQSYLAQQRALDKKYAVIDRTFKEVAVTITAAQDVLATYTYNDALSAKDIQERHDNWQKTSRDWRVASKVLSQNIAVTFANPEIQKTFKEIVDRRRVLGNDISHLPFQGLSGPGGPKKAPSPALTAQVAEANKRANDILDSLQICGSMMAAETKPP